MCGPCAGPGALRRPLDWFTGEGLTERVAREFDGWSPWLTALITDSDTPPAHRPHYGLPIGLRWERVLGVTLLGDAAHLAAPDGEGANLALQDAAELGTALAAHPGDAEAALHAYEEALFPRGEEHAKAAAYQPTAADMTAFFAPEQQAPHR